MKAAEQTAKAEEVATEVSRATGVSVDDVNKVLEHLGLSEALDLVSTHLGKDKVEKIEAKRFVIGVRLANALIAR